MTSKTQRMMIALVMVLVLLSVPACGRDQARPAGDNGTQAPAPTAVPPTDVPPTPVPTEVPPTPIPTEPPPTDTPVPPTEPPPPTPAPDQNPLEVAEIPELTITSIDPQSGGMWNLSTFRQQATISFTADESGRSGTYTIETAVNTAQQAMHIVVRAEGDWSQQLPSAQAEFIWIGTQMWVKAGDLPWIPVPEEVAEAQFGEQVFATGDFLPYAVRFYRIEPDEEIHGVLSAHYGYDGENLYTAYGTVDGHGEIWVALDGGYVTRYTFDGVGAFAEGFEGSGDLHIVYETYDVGAPIDIQPPLGR
jgi:hypothetical protein